MDFFPAKRLTRPNNFDPPSIPKEVRSQCAGGRKEPAKEDVKYWTGDDQPWRNGTDDSPITDPAVLAREELRKREAEAEDKARAPTTDEHADRLHSYGIRVDFLLYLTFELDLWDWKTWELVQFLVKPLTELQNRCRFSELPFLQPHTGPASVFMSHCWGGKWGDLVAAACSGGSTQRFVWIDIFAVRERAFSFSPWASLPRTLFAWALA